MAWIWLLLVLLASGGALALAIRRSTPARTASLLALPAGLVERACSDGLGELADHPGDVYTSHFEPACTELCKVCWADVAALGPQAADSHRVLVHALGHWNAHAGELQPCDDVRAVMQVAQRAARGLLCALPPGEIDAARSHLEKRLLHGIVAAPPLPGTLLH